MTLSTRLALDNGGKGEEDHAFLNSIDSRQSGFIVVSSLEICASELQTVDSWTFKSI